MSTKAKKKNKIYQSVSKSFISALKIAILLIGAAVLRYILMISKYQKIIANHVEVSTPINSWKRVLEGMFLISEGINPYSGDLLHETPFALQFYESVLHCTFGSVPLMFIAFDIGTGLLLYFGTREYVRMFQEEHKDKDKYPKDVHEYLPSGDYHEKVPLYVLITMLFNPYSLLGCIGFSTMGIHNFFLALFVFSMVYRSSVSGMALAICASMSLYPIILIFPLFLYFVKIHKSKGEAVLAVAVFLSNLGVITLHNGYYGSDLSFIKNVYGCILSVPDLQPNIGLFWYFFTEMFDHFRELFIYSFQINATILYLFPLSIKFRNRPFVLTVALLFLISIFKSYPCLSDLGFVLSFLPTFLHLFSFCQQGFIISVILLMSSCLAPILWHLWIYSASANANFFFGVTLAYAIAQIFLVTDILFAQIKWEFSLKHGKVTKIEGEDALLSLE